MKNTMLIHRQKSNYFDSNVSSSSGNFLNNFTWPILKVIMFGPILAEQIIFAVLKIVPEVLD